ncbi:hypothetical protein PRZ48_015241 [Zasmidium cellare]|uniref:Uncharacterized protein n=1 Tax=Zasmidium cellare TaxID=395010 RepID=A0ABR0DY80_ZASCE|nr:hypothetical protein PRZ48_015241 [Zasmidium cellare]
MPTFVWEARPSTIITEVGLEQFDVVEIVFDGQSGRPGIEEPKPRQAALHGSWREASAAIGVAKDDPMEKVCIPAINMQVGDVVWLPYYNHEFFSLILTAYGLSKRAFAHPAVIGFRGLQPKSNQTSSPGSNLKPGVLEKEIQAQQTRDMTMVRRLLEIRAEVKGLREDIQGIGARVDRLEGKTTNKYTTGTSGSMAPMITPSNTNTMTPSAMAYQQAPSQGYAQPRQPTATPTGHRHGMPRALSHDETKPHSLPTSPAWEQAGMTDYNHGAPFEDFAFDDLENIDPAGRR